MFLCNGRLFQIYECHCKHGTEKHIGRSEVRMEGIKPVKGQKECTSTGIDEKCSKMSYLCYNYKCKECFVRRRIPNARY